MTGRKTNVKGRSGDEGFIRLHTGVTKSPAWCSLSCQARALLIEVWKRHNGKNNGRISMSVDEARVALRIGRNQTRKAFDELVDTGFLICRFDAAFNVKGDKRAREWEITAETCDGDPAKRLYREWRPDENKIRGPMQSPTGDQCSPRRQAERCPDTAIGDHSSPPNGPNPHPVGDHSSPSSICHLGGADSPSPDMEQNSGRAELARPRGGDDA